MNQVAALLSCFNRREITLRCLRRLFELKKDIDVYLVDDKSTDGTFEAIRNEFPQVHLINGTGNLFWNRGMHLAWANASQYDYDYYIWLNDDVLLYENCFTELFDCLKLSVGEAIISGVIETQDKSCVIYGGSDENKRLLVPNGKMKEITSMNGNFVLVPKSVFKILGNLDPVFHHDLGDVDYGLRAKENGIKVFTTRVPIGSGEINNFCRVRLVNASLKDRFKKLYSPLGSRPDINFYFRKIHFGIFNAIIYYIFIHLINLLPDFAVKLLFGNRYL